VYVFEKKVGDEYIMKVAKCNRCFSDEIMLIDNKYICVHCGTEYKEE